MDANLATTEPATSSEKTLPDGTRVRQFVRPSIKIGETYIKPGKDGFTLHVTPERAQGWLSNFAAMKAKGRAVKATRDHRHDVDGVLGDVVDMRIRPDGWLETVHEIRGDSAIKTAEANKDVSIEIKQDFKESDGTIYPGESIPFVTYTASPVVTGIAASTDENQNTFFLSRSMDMAFDKAKHFEAIERLRKLPKGSVTEENATDHVLDHCTRYMALETENADMVKKLALADEKAKSLANPATTAPDKKYLSLAARLGEERIQRAVETGIITTATGEALKGKFIGDRTKGEFSPIMLSMSAEDGDSVGLLDEVLTIIEKNKPVASGEATASQTLRLSREEPDAEPAKGKGKKKNPWIEAV